MTSEYEPVDSSPDEEELALIAALSPAQIQAIDAALLAGADSQWRKVAFLIGTAMGSLPSRVPGVPDVFYARRIKSLVSIGELEAQGDLSRMRYCEVRLPVGRGEA